MLVVASTFADAVTPVRDGLADGSLKRSALEAFLEESEHMAALLLRNGERAAELIRQFKQVAVDQTSEGRRRYELGATLREVLRTLQPQFRNSALRIQLEAADDLGMDGYPGAISQILTNLVLNAQAHAFEGRDGGCVRISAEADGETGVRLVVADDGRGIPAEVLPRIFDPFFTTRFGQGGSGLGLHIVWVLATDRLGGQIHVESTVGSGTRFVLHLPRTAPHPVAESAEGPPPAA
jgi:signal transduction histidine kinase